MQVVEKMLADKVWPKFKPSLHIVQAQATVLRDAKDEMRAKLTVELTKSLTPKIRHEAEKDLQPKIMAEAGLQLKAATGASIIGLKHASDDLAVALEDDKLAQLAQLVPTIDNFLKEIKKIEYHVWSNVNLLETCGQRKRDREKEDNHDAPPQKTSKSSGISAAWSFMASNKNK